MSTATKPRLNREHVLSLLHGMIRIRRFEDKCAELYTQQKIRGFLHLYDGEEAIATGIIPVLGPEDRIVATYREHGHALARGVDMKAVHGRDVRQGDGLFRRARRVDAPVRCRHQFLGGNAIVGGGLPLAAGLGLRDAMAERAHRDRLLLWRGRGGRGRVPRKPEPKPSSGRCRCSMSARTTAMRWAPRMARTEAETSIAKKAEAYGIEAIRSTGWTWSRSRPRRAVQSPEDPRDRQAALPRMRHLPVPRAFDVRRPALPREGRDRRVARTRADPAVPELVARQQADP
jgi:2-oxoisovalerate dehydrogenase E1 component